MLSRTLSRDETIDRDLKRRVEDYLLSRQVPAGRVLEIHAQDGVVTVRGTVNSFYQKQVCAHTCRRVAGVRKLIDAIDVAAAR